MAGQRQLQQDAVDRLVGVELREQRLDLRLRRIGGQTMLEALHAGSTPRLPLRGDIEHARRTVADEHAPDDRKSILEGTSESVSVALGGPCILQKKQNIR